MQKHLHTVSVKIQLVIGGISLLILVSLVLFNASRQENSIYQQNEKSRTEQLQTIIHGLHAIMVTGSASIADEYSRRLKETEGIQNFTILNRHGQEAFRDGRMVAEVNQRLGAPHFETSADDPPNQVLPQNSAHLTQVLQEKHTLSYYEEGINEEALLTFLAPIQVQPECTGCHGDQVEVLGVVKLSTSLANAEHYLNETRRNSILGGLLGYILLMILTQVLIRRVITTPLDRITQAMERCGGSDLTHQVPVIGQDELSRVAQRFNGMLNHLHRSITTKKLQVASLDALVKEFSHTNQTLLDDAALGVAVNRRNQVSYQTIEGLLDIVKTSATGGLAYIEGVSAEARLFSSSLEEIDQTSHLMNEKMSSISTSAAQTSNNLQEIMANLEQVNQSTRQMSIASDSMSHWLNAIRDRCDEAGKIANRTDNEIRVAVQEVSQMSVWTGDIDSVVALINDISEQTGMLALNAAIEAAGAGESGAGFAVVAREVKELANKTVEATRQISEKIEIIRSSTQHVSHTVKSLEASIREISQSNTNIIMGVTELENTVFHVSNDIRTVAHATEELTANSRRITQETQEVVRATEEVTEDSNTITQAVSQATRGGQEMAQKAERSRQHNQEIVQAVDNTLEEIVGFFDSIRELDTLNNYTHGSVAHLNQLVESVQACAQRLRDSVSQFQTRPEPFDVLSIKAAYLKTLNILEKNLSGRIVLFDDHENMVETEKLRAIFQAIPLPDDPELRRLAQLFEESMTNRLRRGCLNMTREEINATMNQLKEQHMAIFSRLDLCYCNGYERHKKENLFSPETSPETTRESDGGEDEENPFGSAMSDEGDVGQKQPKKKILTLEEPGMDKPR